jgi:ubiquinone/menaquinone biosynthesis C-methylase UbiE
VKLSDPTHGLKGTDLEQVHLHGDGLADLRAFWDESARVDAVKAIADSADSDTFETSGRIDAERVIPHLTSEAKVLEIGCGTGRIMQHLAPLCHEVHGVDISNEMVELGRRRLADVPNVSFHHGNGYDLSMFPDATFDVAYSWVVFQHMPKSVAYNYLTEVSRILRTDGLFHLQVPNLLREDHFSAFRHFTQPHFVEHPYPMNFYTPSEIVKMLNEARLAVSSLSNDIVVLARKVDPESGEMTDDSQALLDLPQIASIKSRIESMEARNEQLTREVARMRRVYEHPVVRTARRVRQIVVGRRTQPAG